MADLLEIFSGPNRIKKSIKSSITLNTLYPDTGNSFRVNFRVNVSTARLHSATLLGSNAANIMCLSNCVLCIGKGRKQKDLEKKIFFFFGGSSMPNGFDLDIRSICKEGGTRACAESFS